MILLRILEHDLHRSRDRNGGAIPLLTETPARPEFLPAVVSSSRGKFLVSNKLVNGSLLRSGVFPWDSDRLDDLIEPMFSTACKLSESKRWKNVLKGRNSISQAFDLIRKNYGMDGQPHVCLIPDRWSSERIEQVFGSDNLDSQFRRYGKYCRIVPCNVNFPIFLSRPDMVGIYTQFLGGNSSIVLHNIRRGIAFCPGIRWRS